MAKTSRDARRHIRELSGLFSTVNTVGCAVVEGFIKKHEQRKYLKQSLRRLLSNGFISRNGQEYTPTSKGKKFFGKILKDGKEKELPIIWDNKWRLVAFDVPCKDDKKRYQIRSLLKEFHFCQLQKSVWICPNSLSENFWKSMVNEELNSYCKTMVVEVMEGEEELKRRFRLD